MGQALKYSSMLLLVAALALSTACEDASHTHGSGGHSHGGGGHDHGGDHEDHGGEGHDDHGGGGHGHGGPSHVVTKFGEHTELFVEFPPLVAGQKAEFAAHFTRLDDYSPIRQGTLSVVLTSQESPGERWEADQPARPGIFTPTAAVAYAGERQLILVLETEGFTERFDLGTIQVHEDAEQAAHADIGNPEGEISFLKEQQWKVDFGVAEAIRQKMRPSVGVNAHLRPASDAEAAITAPFDGRLVAGSGGVPRVGKRVEAGQPVAYVVPRLDPGEISRLRSQVRKARTQLERAEREVERLGQLAEAGAVPKKRLLDAESQREVARAELEQSQSRLRQSQNLASRGGTGNGRVAIRSPIAGTVVARNVVDGTYVTSGQSLLRVVDRSKLWLEAKVPEAKLDILDEPSGVWFRPRDGAEPVQVDAGEGGQLVTFGEVIDPRTRTVSLIFSLDEPDPQLRVGAFIRAHVFAGQPRKTLAIPTSSVLDEKGLDVVFVMVAGESFERRTVRLGMRDRGFVEVLDGLKPGEHVVSQGAYFVKLAGTATGSVGHGHTH